MAILDESFYDPVPGYTQTRRRRTETPPPADVPRGGMPVPGPLGQAPSIPEEPRETYADPLSATRGMRYGSGDERDLSVPVIDPRSPLAPSPATWSGVVPLGSGRAAYSTGGGYAYTNAPAVPDETTPRVPFADAAGESLAATAARGARMQAEQEKLGLTTADMDYIRTYGRAAYDARQAKYGQPTTRADYLARQGQNLAISVAERNAAQQELSRIERDNADARRREMWAEEQAGLADRARIAASAPVSFGAGAGAIPNAEGGWDYQTPPPGTAGAAADNSWRTEVARIEQETQLRVKELENQGLDRRQAQEIAARERVQKLQNEGNLSVAQAQAQGRTDAATATAQGRVDAATATAEGRVKAAGIRADAQKYASDNSYRAAADAATARVEAAKAAGLSDQQVAQIRTQSEERIARLAQDGALARAGIQADAQKYIADNRYAAAADAATARVEAAKAAGLSDQQVAQIRTQSEERIARLAQDGALARAGIQADAQKYIADNRYAAAADAAAAAVMAADAGAGAKVEAERIRAEAQRLFAQENPWQAIGGGMMGNRQTGETAGTPNAAGGGAARPQLFKMKGAGGAEALVSVNPDGRAQVVFEDPEAAEAIVEQEIRNLKSDKLRYGFTPQQIEGYDAQIAEAEGRLKALREARRSAPDFEGAPPAGAAPTNNADDGWTAFGGIVR